MYVSAGGRVFFGASAVSQHRQEANSGRRRFDNLKRMLSDAEVDQDLFEVSVGPELDPTRKFRKGDFLLLYLAWLTDLALLELTNHFGGDMAARYVLRRFAIPCFESEIADSARGRRRASWAEREMTSAILRAQVLADTLSGKWGALTVDEATPALDAVKVVDIAKLRYLLADHPTVREPVAAGSSQFDDKIEVIGEQSRAALLVIDAGAGTTDFALFQVLHEPATGNTKYSLISPSVRMTEIAGNAVDEVLQPLILTACGLDPSNGAPRSDEDFAYIKTDLSSQIRNLKEVLLDQRQTPVALRANANGSIGLRDLTDSTAFKALGGKLLDIRKSIFSNLFSDDFLRLLSIRDIRYPVYVMLTGGSSRLPIIQKLAEGSVNIRGATITFIRVEGRPSWIKSLEPQFEELVAEAYTQCAVAIGGSAPALPLEIPDVSSLMTPPRSGKRVLERYQVTGLG